MQTTQSLAPAASSNRIEKHPIPGVHHVYHIDWDDNGIQKEVAVVLEAPDGTIYGILVENLHPIDRKRLQRFVTSIHADKYPLWELLSQGKLTNGMNALDFFHEIIKRKAPRGGLSSLFTPSASTSIADGLGQTHYSSLTDETVVGMRNVGQAQAINPSEIPRM